MYRNNTSLGAQFADAGGLYQPRETLENYLGGICNIIGSNGNPRADLACACTAQISDVSADLSSKSPVCGAFYKAATALTRQPAPAPVPAGPQPENAYNFT